MDGGDFGPRNAPPEKDFLVPRVSGRIFPESMKKLLLTLTAALIVEVVALAAAVFLGPAAVAGRPIRGIGAGHAAVALDTELN